MVTHRVHFDSYLKSIRRIDSAGFLTADDKLKKVSDLAYQKGKEEAESFFNMQLVEYRKELSTLHEAMAKNLDREYQVMVNEFKARVPNIVLSLLKKVWSHLEWDGDSVRSMIDEALMAYAPGEAPLEVYLSPSDMTLFEEMDIHAQYGAVVFKEDLSLNAGDCLVKSRFGLMDGRLETKLRRVEEEISSNLSLS